MNLEHGLTPVAARWDAESNRWDVGQKKIYRWLDQDNKPVTDWFKTIREALDWLIEHGY